MRGGHRRGEPVSSGAVRGQGNRREHLRFRRGHNRHRSGGGQRRLSPEPPRHLQTHDRRGAGTRNARRTRGNRRAQQIPGGRERGFQDLPRLRFRQSRLPRPHIREIPGQPHHGPRQQNQPDDDVRAGGIHRKPEVRIQGLQVRRVHAQRLLRLVRLEGVRHHHGLELRPLRPRLSGEQVD